MKKINRKGFTLVELLAIIIILAIILIITVPAVLSTIDNSKKNSLESAAKGVAKWWNTTAQADQLESNPANKKIVQTVTDTFTCIGSTEAAQAGISDKDYNVGGTAAPVASIGKTTCSMVKIDTAGNYQVVLVAKENGKLWIAGSEKMYYDTEAGNLVS